MPTAVALWGHLFLSPRCFFLTFAPMRQTLEISPRFTRYASAISVIPSSFEESGREIYSGRNTLRAIPVPDGGKEWVVKRYKLPNIFQKAAYSVTGRSKARKAYDCGERIDGLGIRTPEVVAMIDCTLRGGLQRCYFVSSMVRTGSLIGMFVDNPVPPADIAAELARFIAELHSRGILHGDLNLSNILYDPAATGTDRFILIDTNRTRFVDGWPSDRRCVANLVRITHWRPALRMIIEAYARERGWNPEETYAAVERRLKRFELSRRVRHFIKRILLGK